MTVAAIVVAGGGGTRMQATGNKVFLEVGGRTILDYSLQLFESSPMVSEVVLVARLTDFRLCEPLQQRYPKLKKVVPGGNERHRSEFAGLGALAAQIDAGKIDRVLVHDAVRPFASARLVERLLAATSEVIGSVPGLPVPATTVLVEDGWILGYPKNLYAVQTPQAFQATWLLEAHNKAARKGFIGTDTASVVEWAGGEVAVVEGEADNIKITSPGDLARAERIAATR